MSASPQLANIPDSVYGNTMLMMAIINQDYDLFKLLIDNGANFNYHNTYDGSSPIIEACSYRVWFQVCKGFGCKRSECKWHYW